jgi:hypothetical protein
MNILSFHLNVPAEITLERPEGTLVQGRYGDRVMFTLADGRIMYVPPFVASKIQAENVAPGDRSNCVRPRSETVTAARSNGLFDGLIPPSRTRTRHSSAIYVRRSNQSLPMGMETVMRTRLQLPLPPRRRRSLSTPSKCDLSRLQCRALRC